MGRWMLLLAFLLLLQGTAVVVLLGWYSEGSLCRRPPPAQGKVHVLLVSSWRSGSSFLGQVFSQHPSVFYLMEPAWHVWSQLSNYGRRKLKMAVRDLVHSVFQCDLSAVEAYLPEQHNVSSLFMWSQSRALCTPPACALAARDRLSDPNECQKKCDARGLRGAEAACRSYSHVVLKEVRFFELESLYPLLRDPSLDLRIVHLVRDPRAVMSSREKKAAAFYTDSGIVLDHAKVPDQQLQLEVMQEVCRSHVRIHEQATQKPPDFLRGRYKMVRYEDIVRNTLVEVNDLYKFVGLEMTTRVGEWIYKVTHGKDSKGGIFEIISQNATYLSQAWRATLDHSKVVRIQELCKGAMSLLGYRIVNSVQEQKGVSVDPVSPKGGYEFSWLPAKTETDKGK
ncbi:carbohydrate sulfotransferase 6 [Gadus macrocephalus]|uniref:carbohydrate sulfotransferase 6 n=1 Tax=Gadus macrocephalus TaxID=80720 RepID=UPI0028CB1D7E|nr:carbohydrate sulfotransferase 6 [Gadus macrocephalus]XP_059917077.1 carbohydrate sulfotransferase 6 [Gadus macrocephalus]XP_059917078.1 carbohydrate sulfotransferase 6 [Gadus macrocephalus]